MRIRVGHDPPDPRNHAVSRTAAWVQMGGTGLEASWVLSYRRSLGTTL